MEEVESVLLLLVIGQGIFAFAERMVSAAVLICVIQNGRGERCRKGGGGFFLVGRVECRVGALSRSVESGEAVHAYIRLEILICSLGIGVGLGHGAPVASCPEKRG